MRITVPISRVDYEQLPEWVAIHQYLQPGAQHDLHFVVPHSLASEAFDAAAQLADIFQSVKVHEIDHEPVGGWPIAPNYFFYKAAEFMFADSPNTPFFFVELDCRPLRSNSYDAVAAQYTNCGAAFFGHVGFTPWRDDVSKRIVPSPYGKEDVMMSGCAVYPGNLVKRSQFEGLMADFSKGPESIEVPWDMHLRGAMRAEGMGQTDLIANHWNTENYRIENGNILCDSREYHESMEPGWELRKCGGKINLNAAFVHGCKDETLSSLIVNGMIPNPTPERRQKSIKQEAAQPSQPPPNEDVEGLKDQVASLTKMMEQFMKAQMAAQVRKGPGVDTITHIPAPAGTIIAEEIGVNAIIAHVPVDKPIRLATLSGLTRIPALKLRQLITAHPEKFAPIKGPAGWVTRAPELQTA